MKQVINSLPPPLWQDDADTLQQLKKNNSHTHKCIFKTYHILLYHFAFDLIEKMDEAEKIMRDAFYKLKLHRHSFTAMEALKPFLLQAVHDACTAHLQHYGVTCPPMDSEQVQHSLAKAAKKQCIIRVIETMPQQMKDVFILAYIEDDKPGDGEIAAQLQIPPALVRQLRRKGIQRLKEALAASQ